MHNNDLLMNITMIDNEYNDDNEYNNDEYNDDND